MIKEYIQYMYNTFVFNDKNILLRIKYYMVYGWVLRKKYKSKQQITGKIYTKPNYKF